ncbi:MAG: DUF1573 domain-containing protein [Flavobacteriales bacterium]|nr:DUF1573 domain-containing protein [Flavobacteriales bacterium]
MMRWVLRLVGPWCPIAWLAMVLAGCQQGAPDSVDSSFIHIPGEHGSGASPAVTWSTDSVDLGILAAGELAQASYAFTNTGTSPLVIAQVLPSCGCTVARDWSSDPIAPGATGTITLEFDAGNRAGTVTESATVVSNAIPSSTVLTFSARVMGPGTLTTP